MSMKYSSDKLAEISVFHGAIQKISELSPVISLLREEELSTVVEVGTMQGGTFWLWCQMATDDALLASIDLPCGEGGSTLEQLERIKLYGKAQQNLHFIRQDSHAPETLEALEVTLGERKADLLVIDGDHTYEGVKNDFEFYSTQVKKGGYIFFHDINKHSVLQNCKVDEYWNEIKSDYQHWEFIDNDDDRGWGTWGGIGLLRYE